MATDDERRRVAAALRGMHDYETPIPIIRTCLGLRPGMLMDGETRRRMSDRLADLIEPSCDREELLALADEMCDDAWRGKASEGWTASVMLRIGRYARRIRKACGLVA